MKQFVLGFMTYGVVFEEITGDGETIRKSEKRYFTPVGVAISMYLRGSMIRARGNGVRVKLRRYTSFA